MHQPLRVDLTGFQPRGAVKNGIGATVLGRSRASDRGGPLGVSNKSRDELGPRTAVVHTAQGGPGGSIMMRPVKNASRGQCVLCVCVCVCVCVRARARARACVCVCARAWACSVPQASELDGARRPV